MFSRRRIALLLAALPLGRPTVGFTSARAPERRFNAPLAAATAIAAAGAAPLPLVLVCDSDAALAAAQRAFPAAHTYADDAADDAAAAAALYRALAGGGGGGGGADSPLLVGAGAALRLSDAHKVALAQQPLAVLLRANATSPPTTAAANGDSPPPPVPAAAALAALRGMTRLEMAAGAAAAMEAEVARLTALVRSGGGGGGESCGVAAAAARASRVALEMGPDTFFLSTTCGDVEELAPHMDSIESEVDLIELRADLLARHDDHYVLSQVAKLKALSGLPVLFTVRSASQCGSFQDDPAAIAALTSLGLRSGVEWLDVEACWDPEDLAADAKEGSIALALPQRTPRTGGATSTGGPVAAVAATARALYPHTKVLGSTHLVGAHCSRAQAQALFTRCALAGLADGVKVVLTAFSEAETLDVQAAKAAFQVDHPGVPAIGICLGHAGKLSRVLNRPFTPVCTDAFPAAAPGQMTAKEIMAARRQLLIPPKRFVLLGHGISASPSPDMHNGCFGRLGLPHTYGLCDVADAEAFKRNVLDQPDFGGASVTIPHKQNVQAYLDSLSPSARALGAVNTIVVDTESVPGSRRLLGDNTDWLGILRPVSAALHANPSRFSPPAAAAAAASEQRPPLRVGVVVGSGGTARAAAFALGVRAHGAAALGLDAVVVVNERSPQNAEALALDLAARLNDEEEGEAGSKGRRRSFVPVASAGSLASPDAIAAAATRAVSAASGGSSQGEEEAAAAVVVDVLVSTLPGAAGFTMPEWLADQAETGTKPVVLDVVYKPPLTALVRQALGLGCPTVPGATMLVEQGLEQAERWTKRPAPRAVMTMAVLKNILAPNPECAEDDKAEAERVGEIADLFRGLPNWGDLKKGA